MTRPKSFTIACKAEKYCAVCNKKKASAEGYAGKKPPCLLVEDYINSPEMLMKIDDELTLAEYKSKPQFVKDINALFLDLVKKEIANET